MSKRATSAQVLSLEDAPPIPTPSRELKFDVVIVGGGFSGAAFATHLLRLCPTGTSIALAESRACIGRGLAYGTTNEDHVLNVRTGQMSLDPEKPCDFLLWLRANQDAKVRSDAFVPRAWFGRYVEERLIAAIQSRSDVFFSSFHRAVISAAEKHDRAELTLSDGRLLTSKFVVLATGNAPPAGLFGLESGPAKSFLSKAWSAELIERAENLETVLVVGSGLSAVDTLLSLARHGFCGKGYMLSRHGLLPGLHIQSTSAQCCWPSVLPITARQLMAMVREKVNEANRQGLPWQDIVDSLRPISECIWKGLPLREQQRFIRHVRPFWDSHRHRMSPKTDQWLGSQINRGDLEVLAGRLVRCTVIGDKVEVMYRQRKDGCLKSLVANRIVNCTGSSSATHLLQDRLMSSLIAQKIARPNALGLGLDVREGGELVTKSRERLRIWYALGPVTQGCRWETTAVPEIRLQALTLARLIAEQVESSLGEMYSKNPSNFHRAISKNGDCVRSRKSVEVS